MSRSTAQPSPKARSLLPYSPPPTGTRARWSEPDRFLPERREGASLAFATGTHRCLGEWMARQQVLLAVERLLSRLPDLRLDGEVAIYGFEFRGPMSLPVAWG